MYQYIFGRHTDSYPRQNPAVVTQAPKVFVFIAQALESEALTGQTAAKVVEAAKLLLRIASLEPAQLLQQLTPEAQNTVRAHFA